IVLRVRPRRLARAYARVWTPAGSPLMLVSRAQAQGLADRLGPGFAVELGMRYGEPALAGALDRLARAGCRTLVVLPLFPQYAGATTASVFDAVAAWAGGRRDLPSYVFVRGFATHPAYVDALAATIREQGIAPRPHAPLLFSFHGLPRRHADEGDPYPHECEATARAVAEALSLEPGTWRVVYQSRFGREPWLEPRLDATLRALPSQGVREVAVLTPSFVTDCLETVDEVGRQGRRLFEEAGGRAFVRVPCLNEHPRFLAALEAVVRAHVPPALESCTA
ncbi:MAG: ferrochelatase, partial [Planctomycetota bacterium]